jgi:DNA-binding NtrC family response regulator
MNAVQKTAARVLVVEDDPGVRKIISRVLERAGYRRILTGSGDEALARLHEGEEVDLILCDVGLPGTPVSRCLEEFARVRPGTPVLLMSGHGAREIASVVGEHRHVAIRKPFEAKELLERVGEALSDR